VRKYCGGGRGLRRSEERGKQGFFISFFKTKDKRKLVDGKN
jgi:hypothetical protein